MELVNLGNEGLKVSRMGLGCMGMSDFYKGIGTEADSIKTIHFAIERGLNFLDTADMYGPFTNEELVGKAIKGKRDKLIIATKFGNERSPDGKFLGVNGRPEYVKQCCHDSLKRLGVEAIDLYYQHRVDPNVPIEETIGAMKDLYHEGKICFIGLSEAAPETIMKAHRVHPISALQTEYSLWTRDPEKEILPLVRKLGIGYVAYSPLGRGFLTGQFQSPADIPEGDYRKNHPRFQGENFNKNLELVKRVEEMARKYKKTPAQIALAWLMSQGNDIVPIPGTRRSDRLDENLGALDVKLTDEDIQNLTSAFPMNAVHGARYADMSTVNR
jgi:aryl-alcohol dehydrogenase-like predicted oxidoreductase